MTSPGRLSALWQRYLTWRRAEGVTAPKMPDAPVNKLAIDDGDVATIVTANIGNAVGGNG